MLNRENVGNVDSGVSVVIIQTPFLSNRVVFDSRARSDIADIAVEGTVDDAR